MDQAERLKKLFDGLDRVYGVYRVTKIEDSGKHVGEGNNVGTRQGKVTVELWRATCPGGRASASRRSGTTPPACSARSTSTTTAWASSA